MKKKIVICEDHPIYAKGLSDFLQKHFQVSAVLNNGEATLRFLAANKVDILLLDLNMKGMNGIEVIEDLKKTAIKLKIVVISMYNDKILIEKCKRLGVHAYCNKQVVNSELLLILNMLRQGDFIVDSSLKRRVEKEKKIKEDFEKKYILTKREKELIQLFSEGLSNKEIANKLLVSSFTIDTHKKNIFRKLAINSTVELVKFYYENF